MKIAFVGSHPLLETISAHVAKKHVITSPTWADLIIVGGYATDSSFKFDYFFKKPTILLSSYLVYAGSNHSSNIDEDTATSIHPLSDLSTIALNYLIREKVLLEQGNTAVLRIFPIVGAGTSYLDRLCIQARLGLPGVKQRLGWRSRSFLFVDDLLTALDVAIQHHIPGIYNIGSDEAISIQDCALTTWQLAGLSTNFAQEEPWLDLPWRPTRIVPNIDRFKATYDIEFKTKVTYAIKFILDKKDN